MWIMDPSLRWKIMSERKLMGDNSQTHNTELGNLDACEKGTLQFSKCPTSNFNQLDGPLITLWGVPHRLSSSALSRKSFHFSKLIYKLHFRSVDKEITSGSDATINARTKSCAITSWFMSSTHCSFHRPNSQSISDSTWYLAHVEHPSRLADNRSMLSGLHF